MRDTDILQDLAEDEVKNIESGLYSPMMRKHIRGETEAEKRMKEDSFEVTHKQTDPDYETIHFNRGQGSQRRANERVNERASEPNPLDKIESASVLDFSSHKRDLVLGIDRKPELKPLSVFKHSLDDHEKDLANLDCTSLELDINEESETISEMDEEHQEIEDAEPPEENTESETSTLSENPFLKHQSQKFKVNKSKSSPHTTKVEFHSPPKHFVKRNFVDNGTLKNNLTAALIRQFNHGDSEKTSPEINQPVKASTKELINKES